MKDGPVCEDCYYFNEDTGNCKKLKPEVRIDYDDSKCYDFKWK